MDHSWTPPYPSDEAGRRSERGLMGEEQVARPVNAPPGPPAAPPPEDAAAVLTARFGVPCWWGRHTRRFWALVPNGRRGRLVEAATPQELAAVLMSTR